MNLRDRVVRVSLRSDADGVLEERGTIERLHEDHAGSVFGYTVLWDALPPRFEEPRALEWIRWRAKAGGAA